MKVLLYSVFVLLLAPCNASKNVPASQADDKSKSLRTVEFTLQRTACFGKCPVFLLTIDGKTNKATYKGDMNTEKTGTYEKNISDEELGSLVSAFDKADFFGMQDEYNKSQVMDVPSTYISYSVNGKTKKIKDRWEAPSSLKALEKLLDDVAGSDGWNKVE